MKPATMFAALAALLLLSVSALVMADTLGTEGNDGLVESSGSAVNASGVISSDLSAASGIEIVFGIDNDAVTPSLQLEPGSGLYASSDNQVRMALGGASVWSWTGLVYAALSTGAASMLNETASMTNPTFAPYNGDSDTGLGGDGADGVSLVAGGVTVFAAVEAAGVTTSLISLIPQGNLTNSCTTGQWALDTTGLQELCYCRTTNTWACGLAPDGPAD